MPVAVDGAVGVGDVVAAGYDAAGRWRPPASAQSPQAANRPAAGGQLLGDRFPEVGAIPGVDLETAQAPARRGR